MLTQAGPPYPSHRTPALLRRGHLIYMASRLRPTPPWTSRHAPGRPATTSSAKPHLRGCTQTSKKKFECTTPHPASPGLLHTGRQATLKLPFENFKCAGN